ncbi:DUF975 family protein [Hathewaya massiliensis]|uniref:DUF975 family protein n=1 Tax=Hathewaya massiliensis TaxID=1964382 RepID=UPI0011598A09|nr:DUF975 family protein [Hathewaya massiliensis]
MRKENVSSNAEIKTKAKEALKGNWGVAIASCIIYGLLLQGFSFVINMRDLTINGFTDALENSNGDFKSSIIVLLINVFLAGAMTYGLNNFFIKLIRRENADIKDVFEGFKHYKGTFFINLLLLIYQFLWALMFIVPVVIILIIAVVSVATDNISITAILLVCLVIIVVSIVLSIILFRYSMSFYIYIDNPELTASEVIKESIDMMEGNQIRLFKLYLSFILWFLLSIITLGIAMIWVGPYMQTCTAVFYEELKDEGWNSADINNIF